ncbi:MAG: hypothetical protein DMF85_15580 [Acidobacteria bacterium]|nr:MAG: hypothetical protein DMF85_15580 [Acidobacteriota bacterium]
MATQNYASHPHRPTLTIVGYAFWGVAVVGLALRYFGMGGRLAFAAGLGGLLLAVVTLLVMSRRYTTALQDRIIRLEMRTRCGPLLTADQQRQFAQLSKPQLVPSLLDRAVRENLSADDIKRAIKNWQPDWDRT